MSYYDGAKLLSMLDINGKPPELYICTTNRTGGKTTFFSRLCVNKFLRGEGKFCLFYRYSYELDGVADKFFRDIQDLFFPQYTLSSKKVAKGIFHTLYLSKGEEQPVPCGYAVAINAADQLKKYSHFFNDVNRIFFDEFQSETSHYCPDEIKKFLSVYISIARGKGKQHRYVPVYMCSNSVSIVNPYYSQLGISVRLKAETHFLRGDGFVLEQGYIHSAAQAQKNSGLLRAFSTSDYVNYASQNVYLNDNLSFIDTPTGRGKYLCTLRYKGKDYGLTEYADNGIVFCTDKADLSFPSRIAVTKQDHTINFVMLKKNDFFLGNLRYLFERGSFRFKNLQCKEAVMCALSY